MMHVLLNLHDFTFLNINLSNNNMKNINIMSYENSTFGIITSWLGRVGSSHRKWTTRGLGLEKHRFLEKVFRFLVFKVFQVFRF